MLAEAPVPVSAHIDVLIAGTAELLSFLYRLEEPAWCVNHGFGLTEDVYALGSEEEDVELRAYERKMGEPAFAKRRIFKMAASLVRV